MKYFIKLKWIILLAGFALIIILFGLSARRSQSEPYYDKSVIYKEELSNCFQLVNLEQSEIEALLLPMVSDYLTWEDIYYIYDTLGYSDVVSDRSGHTLSSEITREEFLEVYQVFLEMIQVKSEVVSFIFWGHVPEESRIITDQGNYNTILPEEFFTYGGTYEVLCDENNILLVILEKTPIMKQKNVIETSGESTGENRQETVSPHDVALPSTVRAVLTNDNGQEELRTTFQIKCTSKATMTCGDKTQVLGANAVLSPETLSGIWGNQAVVIITPETNQSLHILEADTGQWSAPYRGNLLIYKKGEQYWLVNQVALEDYLLGVVPGEMPERFSLEALKAQAVCARTYVCNMIRSDAYEDYGADVDDSVSCQVYNKHGENAKATQAVTETAGVVLLEHGECTADFQSLALADIYYFSTSCGFTTGLEAWGEESKSYLKTVSTVTSSDMTKDWDSFLRSTDVTAYDSGSNYFRWQAELTLPEGCTFKIEKREDSGIVTKISYHENGQSRIVETENEIRQDLGNYVTKLTDSQGNSISMNMLPSAWFSVEQGSAGNKYKLYGGGYGHGIGMSQYGAHGMAEMGMTYDEILTYYFPGIVLKSS